MIASVSVALCIKMQLAMACVNNRIAYLCTLGVKLANIDARFQELIYTILDVAALSERIDESQ